MKVILSDDEAESFFNLKRENAELRKKIDELNNSLARSVSTSPIKKELVSGNTTHLDILKAKQDELEIPAVFQMDNVEFPSPPYTSKTVQSALPTMEKIQKKKKERFDWQPHMNAIKSIVNEGRISRRNFSTLLNTFPIGGRVDAKFLRAKLLALGVAIDDRTGTLSWDMTKSSRHPSWKTL